MGNKHGRHRRASSSGDGTSAGDAAGAGAGAGSGSGPRGLGSEIPAVSERTRKRLRHTRRASLESLERKGGVHVGDVFVTWHSSRLKEVSYMEGTVTNVFEQAVNAPLFGDETSRQAQSTTYVTLTYQNGRQEELSVRDLRSSVMRAQQAMLSEKEWMEKVRELGLSPGMIVDVWVTDSHPAALSSVPADEGGDIHPYASQAVHIGWQYQDIVVELDVARIGPDGQVGETETLPFSTLKAMLQDGRVAQEILQQELRLIAERDGIFVFAKVDLWIESLDTNVRGVITDIGHKFESLHKVELQPSAQYYVQGCKHQQKFETYVDFITSWKQAKYVAEQQFLLRQEARAQGVTPGAEVCVFQPPHSARCPHGDGCSLDAEVMDIKFDFNSTKYVVTMLVLVLYKHTAVPAADAAGSLESKLAMEWLLWDELTTRLRCKVVISNISAEDLIDPGHADPYVKVVIGGVKHKTPYLTDAKYPAWPTETFVFREGEDGNRRHCKDQKQQGKSFFDQKMTVIVYDHNRFAMRTFMGTAELDLRRLLPSGRLENVALKLGPRPSAKNPRRTIYGKLFMTIAGVGPGIVPTEEKNKELADNPEFQRQQSELGQTGRDLFFKAFSS